MDAPLPLDHDSFADWAAPHLPALIAVAIREVGGAAEDVVQNTLLRAWQRRSSFDAGRGSARAWLVAILLDQSRRCRTRRPAGTAPLRDEPDAATRPPDDRVDVEAAVRRLAPRQRQVVVLHYLADLSVAEVAALLGITDGAVKAQLSDARARLREILESRHD